MTPVNPVAPNAAPPVNTLPLAEDDGTPISSVATKRRLPRAGELLDRYSGVLVLIALVVLFGILRPHTFLTIRTLRTLAADQAVTAIASMGLLIAFACGAFDLSIGGALGLAVVMVSWLQSDIGINPVVAVALTLLIGVGVGVTNGIVVTKLRVSSFIATLAMASIIDAVIYGVSGGNQIIGTMSSSFLKFGQGRIFGIPDTVYYMAAIALIVWYLLEHTPAGRYLYAVGSNNEAARLAGVSIDRYVFGSLVASAFLASVAGVVFAAKIGSASLSAGPPYLLPAFAAVFLGSTQIRPGRVNVWGTILAIFLVATGTKGLQLMGVPIWVSSLFNGLILIVAVSLAQLRRRVQRQAAG